MRGEIHRVGRDVDGHKIAFLLGLLCLSADRHPADTCVDYFRL